MVKSRRFVAKISDVARAAGVSPATVSRVLNGSADVRSDLKERVVEAARRLGYVPFSSARTLRRQQASIWAAIVTDIENPFFTAVVRGVGDVAHANGCRLVLCNSDENLERENAYIDVAVAERMAGVVIAVASAAQSSVQRLLDLNIPVVAVDRPAGDDIDAVVVDNRHGADEAVRHLIDSGRRRIGCITGPTRVATANERLAGYRNALKRAGMDIDARLIRRADYKEEGGYQAVHALLQEKRSIDALFIANSPMAAGALRALREAGLSSPRDVALVAFDDAPWCRLTSPSISVVAQPAYDIGRVAGELLADTAARPARRVVLKPQLVIRESSSVDGGLQ